MNRSKTTLADIAAKTGYGTNTVSLALRGSTRISKAARAAVLAAARELDYVPNNSAKSLVLKRSHTVGFLVPEFANPLMNDVARIVQVELMKRGYSMFFANSNSDPENEIEAITKYRSLMVDGLLIYPQNHEQLDHLARLRRQGFPIVMLIASDSDEVDSVGIDEFQGAFDATSHLIALGHTRVGGILERTLNPEKFHGFRAALRKNKIELVEDWVRDPAEHAIAAGIEATDKIMSGPAVPTAIFAASDLLALGVLRWAKTHGLAVPERLSIAGFDDIEYARQAYISLTTVQNDVETLGRMAVERLLTLIETAGPLPAPRSNPIYGRLAERESSGVPPPLR